MKTKNRYIVFIIVILIIIWSVFIILASQAFALTENTPFEDSIYDLHFSEKNEIDIELLMKQRLTKPPKCNNSQTYYTDNFLSSEYNNYVPFINRCNLTINAISGNMEMYEMWLNDKIGYIHNFKAGGTTIQNALESLVKDGIIGENSKITYFQNLANPKLRPHRIHLYHTKQYEQKFPKFTKKHFYKWLNNSFLFSFIRDPMDKLLSGFNEMLVRKHKLFQKLPNPRNEAGIEHFRIFLHELQHRSELYKNDNFKISELFPDSHIHPQMYFLLNLDKEYFPFNFIGNIKDIQSSLFQILQHFEYNVNHNTYLREYYHLKTRGHSNKFHLNGAHLNDADIQTICDLYWMDYICVPFDIPKQCNLTQLFEKHYGTDVIYNDCYF